MIVTFSRQLGSGGDVIAARVATELGLRLIDREVILQAAVAAGVPEAILQPLMYDNPRSLAGEILHSLRGNPTDLVIGSAPPLSPLGGVFTPVLRRVTTTPEDAVETLGLIIQEIASQDNVLILGQGGQVLLRGYAGAFHVKVVAPPDMRVARVAERGGLSLTIARRCVRHSDRARADYLARYHGINWLDPLLYHLVINTGQMPVEIAVRLVTKTAHALETQ
jgi:cytidylate kinase